MDNNGIDYSALRGINSKFSMSQIQDSSAAKSKPKTFSMSQSRLHIQNPKTSSTHNLSPFKFALFKKPEALAQPDASRRPVFPSFQAQQRTQPQSSSQNRLSAPLFVSDIQKSSKVRVVCTDIVQDHDVGREEETQGGRDASSPLPTSPRFEDRAYIHSAPYKSPPIRHSPPASHRQVEFSPDFIRENEMAASPSVQGESNSKTSGRRSPTPGVHTAAHTSSSPPHFRSSSTSQANFPRSKDVIGSSSIQDPSIKLQQTPPVMKRDVKRAFSDLLEHNHRYESLFAESIALQAQNEYLTRMRSAATKDLKSTREEHLATVAQLTSTRSELAAVLPMLKSTENELNAVKSDLTLTRSNLADAVAQITSLKTSLEHVSHSYEREKLEKETAGKRLVIAKQGLVTLRENYESLHSSFIALGKSHEASQALLSQAVAETTEIKESAADALTSVEPLLDEGSGLSRMSEMRDTIQELQGELGSSQRVTDLLRDKLHHLSSQLADAQTRVKDLEDTERGSLSTLRDRLDDKQNLEVLLSVGSKVEDLTNRLAKRELESIDALAEAAGVEAKLIAVTHELQNLRISSSANLVELEDLRVIKEDGLSKLLASQEVINAKDKEIVGLKAEVNALGESKAELRALVAEAKKAVAEKDCKLRARDSNLLIEQQAKDLSSQVVSAETSLKATKELLALAQSEARKRTQDNITLKTRVEYFELAYAEWEALKSKLQAEIRDLGTREALAVQKAQQAQTEIKRAAAEAKRVGEDASKTVELLRQGNRRLENRLDEQHTALASVNDANKAIQSRLDAQTTAFTLAKDQSSKFQADLQETLSKLRIELAVVQEQKLTLEQEKSNLKASFNQLTRESAASLASAHVDFEKKMNKQEKANERLLLAQEKRAGAAEKAATLAEHGAKEARTTKEELAGRLAEAEMSVLAIAEDGEAAATRESGQMKIMRARVEELEERVVDMTKHAETLLARYHDAGLTDSEKDLVNHVIRETQTNYEQEVVAKDNKLRRHEHLATGLRSRIKSLEAAIAQVLKEKAKDAGPEAKTMVDFRAWLSSSPIDEPMQALADNDLGQAIAPVPDAACLSLLDPGPNQQEEVIKPPSPIPKPQPRVTKPKKKSFKYLEDADSDYEDDSRDDLSDLSDMELSQPSGRGMRKRDRSLSPQPTVTVEEPVRTKRRLRAPGIQKSAVITAPVLHSPQVGVSTFPVPQKKAPDGPAKSRKKRK